MQGSTRSDVQRLKDELAREKEKNAELQAKYNHIKDAQDSVCKELSQERI